MNDPAFDWKKQIRLQRFLGYDYVSSTIKNLQFPLYWLAAEDTAENKKIGGKRGYIEEHKGPISTWAEFEKFPWPDFSKADTRALEWYNKNLPDDMILIGNQVNHIAEELSWLMGYETLCIALYEDRDLVMDFLCRSDEASIRERVHSILSVCQSGGGYCLGTGNTVANYVPVDNYLTMLDEGRRFK